jgi:protein O-mannosyl-transferase
MLNKINMSPKEQVLIIYVVLAAITLAVFWQVNQFDFISLDDSVYIKENTYIQSGITLEGISWAFSTTYAEFWHPLTWLSLMLDYQLFGLNAGGYHMNNLILHILSTLLLFWLFNRMTKAVWKSAFIAALFALHPMHVESVTWISERKDVLSAFFWMLTLCLYVYYTEKPLIRRYIPVLFSFACALMSKSIVVTLPMIMILLDYWPLSRCRIGIDSKKNNLIIWQLKEKMPFFILSAVFSVITLFAQPSVKNIPLSYRLANAPVAFMTYLEKTFWPHDLAIFYPFSAQIPAWQVIGTSLLIIAITFVVIVMVKRLPYLFVGWMWYAIIILPVIGIIQIGNHSMADRYHYIPSVGIAVMLAWGIPSLIKSTEARKKLLFPAGIIFLTIMAFLTWHQCGYWENNIKLFSHALQVTKDNYLAHYSFGIALVYAGKNEEALEHCNKAIRIKPDYANAYIGRGFVSYNTGQYEQALEDLNVAIRLQPNNANTYLNKGITYNKLRQFHMAIESYNKAIQIQPGRADFYNGRGKTYDTLNKYQLAIEDYNTAIRLKPDFAETYNNRGFAYLRQGNKKIGCRDVQKACELGDCKLLEMVRGIGYCR